MLLHRIYDSIFIPFAEGYRWIAPYAVPKKDGTDRVRLIAFGPGVLLGILSAFGGGVLRFGGVSGLFGPSLHGW